MEVTEPYGNGRVKSTKLGGKIYDLKYRTGNSEIVIAGLYLKSVKSFLFCHHLF